MPGTSRRKINELSSSRGKRIHYLAAAVFTDIRDDNINQRAVSNPSGLRGEQRRQCLPSDASTRRC